MINLTLRVETDEYDEEFLVTPRVQVAFEREFKIGLAKAFTNEQKVEHMYWLAWKCVHASGKSVKPFDNWLDTVKTVEVRPGESGPFEAE